MPDLCLLYRDQRLLTQDLQTDLCVAVSFFFCATGLLAGGLLVGCSFIDLDGNGAFESDDLETVAEFEDIQITGVAVSGTGRLFVNSPFWQRRSCRVCSWR